jgi:hypothetical protein
MSDRSWMRYKRRWDEGRSKGKRFASSRINGYGIGFFVT